jgi:hypothetical protein
MVEFSIHAHIIFKYSYIKLNKAASEEAAVLKEVVTFKSV